MKITKQQLHAFLSVASCSDAKYLPMLTPKDIKEDYGFDLSENVLQRLLQAYQQKDLRVICAGSEMSENHLGGDDLVGLANDILKAIKDGFTIVTWYGDGAECLIAGVSGSLVQEIEK